MEFPFDIYDVADNIGLALRRQHMQSSDFDCPFCGGKGKINLNIKLNTYRCNKCGENGGMLDLFTKCTNISDKKEAYRILAKKSCYSFATTQREYRKSMARSIQEAQKADIETLDHTYRTFLEMIGLSSNHKENLLKRGLSDDEIALLQYRTVPQKGYDELVHNLLNKGCNLVGVPGFFVCDTGEVKINLHKQTGFFVPVYNAFGKIQGLQIRLDEPFDKCKYMWFSSAEKNGGCSSNSPINIAGSLDSPALYITEGALKGQIAHYLSGKTFVSIAGVSQTKELEVLFRELQQNGSNRLILDSLDMDDNTNPHVKKAHNNLVLLGNKYGFVVKRIVWNRQFKGIDDFLLGTKKERSRK